MSSFQQSVIIVATAIVVFVASFVARGGLPESGDDPVNELCPIGQEPIDGATVVIYAGKTVGFCCPGCDKQFLAWDNARKDRFIAEAMSASHGAESEQPGLTEEEKKNDGMYTLKNCPVSGEALGSMGEPIIEDYDGREVRFCCAGCIRKFEASHVEYFKKIDEEIVEDQTRYYAANVCVVSGEPLVEDGEDIAVNMIYGNRLVRLCCKMCVKEFGRTPKKFIERVDASIVEVQRKDYPITTCIVAGGELGSMGEPTEMIVGGRLLRFCCASCEPKVQADPAKYVAEIDAAWQAQGKFVPADKDDAHGAGEADGHDSHDHGR